MKKIALITSSLTGLLLAVNIEVSGSITSDITWSADNTYLMIGQTFVKENVTLTIEPGTIIKSNPDDGNGMAPALVIERGAKIMAEGTVDAPITFTSALEEQYLPQRGTWGGIIILGSAPTSSQGGENFVEGLEGIPYGGTDVDDNSGVIRYVRVWYGGRSIGQDNEINGITLAGVGRGTTIDHCEVAWNLDDGFEFFGGTVDLKYCSVLFVGDDAFDVDEGYQGRAQFLFALVGANEGNRAHEMDNKTNGNLDSQPRSHPIWYNVTLVGSGVVDANGDTVSADNDQAIRVREGVGGQFGNYIVISGKETGLKNSDNGSEIVTNNWSDAENAGYPNYLYWSPNNIIYNCNEGQFAGDYGLSALDTDPGLISMDGREVGGIIDPRPALGSAAYENIDTVPTDDFFTAVNYKGAFGTENWMAGFSWLDEQNRLGTGSLSVDDIIVTPFEFNLLGNYPNPFNPETSIRFSIGLASDVKVNIFNIMGQKIAELRFGVLSPGVHNIEWNAGHVPSGIYFYQIRANNATRIGKMTLMK